MKTSPGDTKRDFKGVLFYIAQFLKIKHDLKGSINDSFLTSHAAFIAEKLEVKVSNVNVWKSRNKFVSGSYDAILGFCFKNDINPLNVFYDRKVRP